MYASNAGTLSLSKMPVSIEAEEVTVRNHRSISVGVEGDGGDHSEPDERTGPGPLDVSQPKQGHDALLS